jgi:hypothetical protein
MYQQIEVLVASALSSRLRANWSIARQPDIPERCDGETECDRTLEWRGITIDVIFEPEWLGMAYTSHLQVRSVAPERAVLPVTETGYRSHFLPIGTVEALGGPEIYVLDWLDETARSEEWKAIENAQRQLSLF